MDTLPTAFWDFRESRVEKVSFVAGFAPLTVLDGLLKSKGDVLPDKGGCGLARKPL
jgi:hypothetical protein